VDDVGRVEILLVGTGGQGIVLQGYILGRASALHGDKESTFIPSYGAEARGGESKAQVVISDEPIDYPYVTKADVMVAMATHAYEKFISTLKEDGVLLYDDELVQLDEKSSGIKKFGIPATKIAEELGNRVIANIVMLGFLIGATGVVSHEAMEKGVADSVPKKFLDLNVKAFQRGYDYAGLKSAVEAHG
jgi:2-oxoglutarate ferredoxin oxidoreductase subunit gamma